jgi:hypothetical protein
MVISWNGGRNEADLDRSPQFTGVVLHCNMIRIIGVEFHVSRLFGAMQQIF